MQEEKRKGEKALQRILNLHEQNTALFEKYVVPNMADVKSLVRYYTLKPSQYEENLSIILEELYRYINTYDTDKPILTWLHICIKRKCAKIYRDMAVEREHMSGLMLDDIRELTNRRSQRPLLSEGFYELEGGSLMMSISDEVYKALMRLPSFLLSPLFTQMEGYSIREITEMEHEKGNIPIYSQSIIQSRIFKAKVELRKLIKEYGREEKRKGQNTYRESDEAEPPGMEVPDDTPELCTDREGDGEG